MQRLKLAAGWDWLARLVRFFRDPLGTEKMVEDFARTFPGKCMICSYHRYGRREGMTTEPTPEHECIEVDSAPKDGTEILLLVRHMNYAYAAPEDRHKWQEWGTAKWIDRNGGGWTWHGIAGRAVAWKPVNKANEKGQP